MKSRRLWWVSWSLLFYNCNHSMRFVIIIMMSNSNNHTPYCSITKQTSSITTSPQCCSTIYTSKMFWLRSTPNDSDKIRFGVVRNQSEPFGVWSWSDEIGAKRNQNLLFSVKFLIIIRLDYYLTSLLTKIVTVTRTKSHVLSVSSVLSDSELIGVHRSSSELIGVNKGPIGEALPINSDSELIGSNKGSTWLI
jgi:hypothetical protein